MPTYDYACTACGHGFEIFEPIGADGKKACPKCGKKRAQRMLGTGVGVIFKGSGFYTTDSRKSSAGKTESKSKESDEGSSKTGKTDGADSKAVGEKKKPEGVKARKKEKKESKS